jgi:hypothetical protein
MKKLMTALAVASLALAGCSSGASSPKDQRTTNVQDEPAATGDSATTATPSATTGSGQAFDYSDEYGYRWHITVAAGQSGPRVHAPNCALGSIDAMPGRTNMALKLTITNLLEDRGEPVPTSLTLSAGDPNNTLIGPDDGSGFSCTAQLSIGRWFEPGESVAMSGIIRNLPDPIPAHSVAVIRDGLSGKTVGPLVELSHG